MSTPKGHLGGVRGSGNALLRQALQVAAEVSQPAQLAARARSILGQWPEMPSVPVPVEKPVLVHITARYGPALELPLLLLWHHSPAPQAGRTAAVALLFDMNRLFEAYERTSHAACGSPTD
jgi:5-methylcytosine-specific restriction endonuclease McrBC regulatory subunit McrC